VVEFGNFSGSVVQRGGGTSGWFDSYGFRVGYSAPGQGCSFYYYASNVAIIQGDAGSGLGKLVVGTHTEANTAGSGSPNILTYDESRKLLTNEGTAAQNYHTLPSAEAGLDFEFVVQDGDGIRITANTGDTIQLQGLITAAAGYISSIVIGSTIRLKAINTTEWIAVSYVGGWTVDGTYPAIAAKTANYTVQSTDETINCTANSFDVTLLSAAGAITGRKYRVKNSGVGTITIKTTSSQTIDGQASGAITLAQYDCLTVQSDGSNWIII
jgi:hypothetical protein